MYLSVVYIVSVCYSTVLVNKRVHFSNPVRWSEQRDKLPPPLGAKAEPRPQAHVY